MSEIKANFWPATDDSFQFPENDIAEIQAKPNTGLCFSGGGGRSLAATIGQLRGLHKLDLLKNIRYISCVSGGSWACAPFTFLPRNIATETFLGPVLTPDKITLQALDQLSPQCHLATLLKPGLIPKYLAEFLTRSGPETYAKALNEIFLKPYGLDDLQRPFSWSKDQARLFYSVEQSRPYLIVMGTVLSPNNSDKRLEKIPFEFTPVYTGAKVFHKNVKPDKDIGGGYVESLAFNSKPNSVNTAADKQYLSFELTLQKKKIPFVLSDVIASSSAAPELLADKIGITENSWPAYYSWPISTGDLTRAGQQQIGDGGLLENFGLLSLLMRKVEKITVFVNTDTPLEPKLQSTNVWTGIDEYIPPLFGYFSNFWQPANEKPYTQVFSNQQFNDLVKGLMAAKQSGKTVLYQDSYDIQANPFLSIPGGWTTTILWVYNEKVSQWKNQLPTDVQTWMKKDIFLKDFPHYKTFGQNLLGVINLSARQSNLLAHLSSWNVINNAISLQRLFG